MYDHSRGVGANTDLLQRIKSMIIWYAIFFWITIYNFDPTPLMKNPSTCKQFIIPYISTSESFPRSRRRGQPTTFHAATMMKLS
jgi:hypothetical protein